MINATPLFRNAIDGPASVTIYNGHRYEGLPIDALDDVERYIEETRDVLPAVIPDDDQSVFEAAIAAAVYKAVKEI
jgi:hypothetical protein